VRIAILTYGSRGDVQPYIALGAALRNLGFTVVLAAPSRFGALVALNGLEFVGLPGDPAQMVSGLVDRAGRHPWRAIPVMIQHTFPLSVEIMRWARVACEGADAVVHSFLFAVGGHVLARQQRVPSLAAEVMPLFAPTAGYPCPAFPHFPRGWPEGLQTPYNRLTHRVFAAVFRAGNQVGYRWLIRREYPDLPRRAPWPFALTVNPPVPILFGFSERVLPRASTWGSHVHTTGYWFLDRDPSWSPPDPLRAFLDRGPPPICIGFGSMISRDPAQVHGAVRQALHLLGRRGVLLAGWNPPSEPTPQEPLLVIPEAPHDWLFPRCSVLVHHGGAGTTAAAFRSGVPGVIVPFAADQPFWGERAVRLGVSPKPIPAKALTARRLAEAIDRALHDRDMQARAQQLGGSIRAERGAQRAAQIIRDHLH
jgi:sterol 3beta-glucosyltransferase